MQVAILKNNDHEKKLAALLLENGKAKIIVSASIHLLNEFDIRELIKVLPYISNARWNSRKIIALLAFILLPEYRQQQQPACIFITREWMNIWFSNHYCNRTSYEVLLAAVNQTMPFSFKKRNKRREIPRDVILRALEEVSKGGKIKTTAIKYDIPRSNLQRYIKQGGAVKDISSKFISSQIFMKDEEEKISEYLVTLFKLNHGMSKLKARELVYEYATDINKKIPDNWTEKKLASNDWLRGFFKRQPHLSIRTPEATSLSRATSFNKKNVRDFFENLKTVYERHCFGPESIYNIDETGLSTVQRTQKVIALRGTKQVGQVTSAERETLVTVCCGINALGNSIPPFFIFPRVNFKTYMLNDAPVGSDGAAHPSGWMTAPCFLKYIHHFAKHAKPTPSSPVLLLLDNHESHISVPVLDFCKESGIVLMTFPPHCSHKLQPLDLNVYGPLKTYYNTFVTDWMVSNPGKTVTIYEIPKLAAKAIPLAFKLQNIQTGFKNLAFGHSIQTFSLMKILFVLL
ncbi:uncharacterized protein LOC136086067 [Hydra vulgaris]|uniref:Uncharacterized protein LOC136086067 n=1 Tax=Hydra vulgaris TaxID=6087 RepID=A0ABM4CRA9_HYDVU